MPKKDKEPKLTPTDREAEIERLRAKLERLVSERENDENDKAASSSSLAIQEGTDEPSFSASSSVKSPQEEQQGRNGKAEELKQYARRRRIGCYFAALLLLVGVSIGIIQLVKFLDDGAVSFRYGSGPTKAISIFEVNLHSDPEDCWTVFHGVVFDLTDYRHPGGDFYIHAVCGIDGTVDYKTEHSERLLRTIRSRHQLGLLGDETTDREFMGSTTRDDGTSNNHENGATDEDNFNGHKPLPDDYARPTWSPTIRITESPTTAAELDAILNGGATRRPTFAPTPVPTPRPTPSPTVNPCPGCISLSELRQHDSTSDCWMAIGGDVYDLTTYARSHPGGSKEIYPYCGMDATDAYERERKHKASDLNVVRSLKVGTYEEL
jgi:cytochrome b involved in lipid metabolism